MDNTAQLGISVIICTYNGALQLPQTLSHLAAQEVPAEINWEIIIVDNASTDATAEVARSEWQQYDLPNVGFSILTESRPRKYYALATGVNNAKYEYIVICDDDNWLNAGYINKAYQTINTKPLVAAAGGQGIAVTEKEIPSWFAQYQQIYAVGKPAATSGDVSTKGYLWGAGMVFRKSLYQKVNRDISSLLLGPDKTESARAEDVELCMRFILAGYSLYYDEELVFKHHISSDRLTEKYRDKLLNVNDHETRVLNLYRKQIGINSLSALKKNLLLVASWLRYLACKIIPGIKKWHYAYEAEVIYLLNGTKMAGVSDDAIRVRELNLSLSKKAVA
ncbi:glycosyltransferase [Mucilaginibacter sp. CAU 1740]|uniref:glycosyltransferase n=1 Tax=Mucilaginibacter sp. CAU 1740 TaxID=3140365 RepID=UPI00325A9F52